jgi:hypothetical protein
MRLLCTCRGDEVAVQTGLPMNEKQRIVTAAYDILQ